MILYFSILCLLKEQHVDLVGHNILSLGIPPQLACGVCSPRMDITTYSMKRKQNQRHPSEHRKCQKYWDDKWLSHLCQSNEKLKSIEMHDNI